MRVWREGCGRPFPELPLSPPDPPEIPERFLDAAAEQLLLEFKDRLENGDMQDEIEERAGELMTAAAESAAEDRVDADAERDRDR